MHLQYSIAVIWDLVVMSDSELYFTNTITVTVTFNILRPVPSWAMIAMLRPCNKG